MTGLIMKLSDADKDTSFHLSDIVFWIEKDLFVLCVSRELSAHRPHCKTKIRSLKKKKKKAERGIESSKCYINAVF